MGALRVLRDLAATLVILLVGSALLIVLPVATVLIAGIVIIMLVGFIIYACIHDARIEKEASENEVPDIRGDSERTEEG
jgi:uncharacterized membrane protein